MRHDNTRLTNEPQDRGARHHIIDVECAPDLGIVVRVLNLLATARAKVTSIASEVVGERMRLRVNARGMSASQGETLRWRLEVMPGVSRVSLVGGK
ncbi:MAG: hypothetical protein M0D54_10925 [Hyphomonadaceae bacterium JAD_PAG50586_4]|nr:MAG: hypothetical protein M0D54_10925 [Hyphomonadaceae bacterium JAD_PAG50586_4]